MRASNILLLALAVSLCAGCSAVGPHEGAVERAARDGEELWRQFQEAVRRNDVGQQYYYYSTTFKGRYKLFEYALMVNGDPTIGGLFRRMVLEWKVEEIGYSKDHKKGWVLLQHPKYPQYRKVLDLVAEMDDKHKDLQWKIDFGLAKFMNLPDAVEVELIADEEKYKQEINRAREGQPRPKDEDPKEEHHD